MNEKQHARRLYQMMRSQISVNKETPLLHTMTKMVCGEAIAFAEFTGADPKFLQGVRMELAKIEDPEEQEAG